jgi:hypothetical protein
VNLPKDEGGGGSEEGRGSLRDKPTWACRCSAVRTSGISRNTYHCNLTSALRHRSRTEANPLRQPLRSRRMLAGLSSRLPCGLDSLVLFFELHVLVHRSRWHLFRLNLRAIWPAWGGGPRSPQDPFLEMHESHNHNALYVNRQRGVYPNLLIHHSWLPLVHSSQTAGTPSLTCES